MTWEFMTKQQEISNSEPPLIDPALIVHDFFAINALNEFYTVNGWDANYRQIEPGPLKVKLLALKLGHIELFRERTNRRLESSVISAEHAYSLIMTLSDVPGRVSGRTVGRHDLLLVPPKTRLNIVIPDGADGLTIHLPADRIDDYDVAFGGFDSLDDITHVTLRSTPTTTVDAFRRMVVTIFTGAPEATANANMDWKLILALADMLDDRKSNGNGYDPYGRLEKHRIMQHATDYVRVHLTEDIRITDLCAYCGVSLSTLERVFRRELDLSPKDYILAIRLHEARRRFWDVESKTLTIAEIAMSCGFTHMGRFSRRYRQHYGRLPSEDRILGANGIAYN